MTDFVTDALPHVNFNNFKEIESFLKEKACNGTFNDLPRQLKAAGWGDQEADRIMFLVERFKIGSFKI